MTIDPRQLRELREHWRGLAREAPLESARVGTDPASFYASGARDVAAILDFVGGDVGRGRAPDLGCGPGRHLSALAAAFEAVDGVDIAPEMLEVARASGLPTNVELSQTSGAELPFPDASFDFVMSLLVFQHIPDDEILLANLREVRRVMNSDGRAVVHLDSRRQSFGVRVVQALPDVLLPRVRRRYIRRYRRHPTLIDRLVREAGLSMMKETGRGSATHFLAVAGARYA